VVEYAHIHVHDCIEVSFASTVYAEDSVDPNDKLALDSEV
jgi:hypothetical protein